MLQTWGTIGPNSAFKQPILWTYEICLWMSIVKWLPRRKYIWPIPKLPDSDGFARWRPPDGPCNRKLEWPPHRSPLHDKTSPSFEMVTEPPFRPEQRYTYTWFRTYEDQSLCIIYISDQILRMESSTCFRDNQTIQPLKQQQISNHLDCLILSKEVNCAKNKIIHRNTLLDVGGIHILNSLESSCLSRLVPPSFAKTRCKILLPKCPGMVLTYATYACVNICVYIYIHIYVYIYIYIYIY